MGRGERDRALQIGQRWGIVLLDKADEGALVIALCIIGAIGDEQLEGLQRAIEIMARAPRQPVIEHALRLCVGGIVPKVPHFVGNDLRRACVRRDLDRSDQIAHPLGVILRRGALGLHERRCAAKQTGKDEVFHSF